MIRRISGYFSVRVIAAAIQAVVLVWLARLLGPAEFGFFAASTAVGSVILTVLGLGARAQALRLAGWNDGAGRATTLLLLRVATALPVGLMMAAVAFGLLTRDPSLAIAVGVYVSAEGTRILAQHALLGLQLRGRANFLEFTRPIVGGAGLGLAVLSGHSPVLGYALGMALVTVVSVAALRPFLGAPTPLKSTVRSSFGYWASTSLVSLQQLDIPLVSGVANVGVAGLYAGASRLTNPLNLAASSILAIITPALSEAEETSSKRALFMEARRIVLGLILAFTLAAPLASYIGPLVLGAEYAGSGPLFAGLMVSVGLNAGAQLYASSYYAHGATRGLSTVRLVTIPAGLIIILLGALTGNIWALACAIALARVFEVGVLATDHRRRIGW